MRVDENKVDIVAFSRVDILDNIRSIAWYVVNSFLLPRISVHNLIPEYITVY